MARPLLALGLLALPGVAQRVTLSGYVEDATSGERLIGATVYDAAQGAGTAPNAFGFRFDLDPDPIPIENVPWRAPRRSQG